jgi:hypothetical protein
MMDLDFYDNMDKIDLNDYESSKEWKIDQDAIFGRKHYRVFEQKNYTVLTYYLILYRNPGFYTYLLIFPCVLLAFLTMTVFWLPPETPAKILLGMNIFSGFFLLLLLLADLVPTSTNEVPFIGIYFCLNMIMIALSVVLCTIVIHIYFRADKFYKMPRFLKKIFLDWLATIYFMQPPKSTLSVAQRHILNKGLLIMQGSKKVPNADKFEKFEILKERFKNYRENILKVGFDNLMKSEPSLLECDMMMGSGSCTNLNHSSNRFKRGGGGGRTASSSTNSLHNILDGTSNPCTCSTCSYRRQQQIVLWEIAYLNNLEHDVKEIRDYLRDTRKKLETKEQKTNVASDWKRMALVLDRTFFFIYLVITFVTLFVLFPKDQFVPKVKTTAAATTSTSIETSTPIISAESILSTIANSFSIG